MEDYREKIEKLPLERLTKLAQAYRVTIRQMESYQQDARIVAIMDVVDYTEVELAKKRAELAEIERLIQQCQQAQ
jgi:hypothetical protein